MLGTVFLVKLAAKSAGPAELDFTVRGITDSQCNTYAMLRNYSRKLPTAAVHMELMSVSARNGVWPRISHVKREYNTWADDLTENKTEGFNPKHRWHPKLHKYFLNVLHKLLDASGGDGVTRPPPLFTPEA